MFSEHISHEDVTPASLILIVFHWIRLKFVLNATETLRVDYNTCSVNVVLCVFIYTVDSH